MTLVIENISLNDETTEILIKNSTIQKIGQIAPDVKSDANQRIDGDGNLAVPTLHNGHTHAAMTLFRGFGDDMPLQEWLEEKIWPLEEQLTDEDVYWATRLACLEMIRTGTTFFNDMYWEFEAIHRAVEDSGLRAMISGVFIDQFDDELAAQQQRANESLYEKYGAENGKVKFALGPHSVYTVSRESLEWIAQFSREHDLPVHIHLAETEWEIEQCKEQHGKTPVRFLDQIDFLHDKVIAAHAIWVDNEEIELLAQNGVSVVHNPLSNLKLTAGDDFPYAKLREAGVPICFGTDGVSSNNNLNLLEEIKMSSLIQKNRLDDPTLIPADQAFGLGTRKASKIFGLNSGSIEEGKLADLMLVETDQASMSLSKIHNSDSHLSYTLTPEAIDTVVCGGEILLENGTHTDQDRDKILRKHRELTQKLCYEG